jgi:hypothetical protein
MFALVQLQGSRRQGGKTAVVVPEDLGYGMARMWQKMSDVDDLSLRSKYLDTLVKLVSGFLKKND